MGCGDNADGGWYCAIRSQISLCCGGCAGQCRVFGSTSDLCPHDHNDNNQNWLPMLTEVPWGAKSPLVEKH